MTNTNDNTATTRTEPKRFTADDTPISADNLIVGDRIDTSLVARTMDGLGETRSPDPDDTTTQLAEATITDRHDDVHQAILVDGDSDAMVRAGRHDSQAAWTQSEADWTVKETGERISVDSADIDQGGDDWLSGDVEAWSNVVLQDRAHGVTDYADELELTSSGALSLREPYGPTPTKAVAEFELIDG